MSDGFDENKKKAGRGFPFEWPEGWPKPPDMNSPGGRRLLFALLAAALAGTILLRIALGGATDAGRTVDFSEFMAMIESGQIRRVRITDAFFHGYLDGEPRGAPAARPSPFGHATREPERGASVRAVPLHHPDLLRLMDEMGVSYYAAPRGGGGVLLNMLMALAPLIFLIILWRFMMKRIGGMGGNALSIGRNRAVIVAEGDVPTKFGDVAGVDEAKEELVEVVDFLKNPRRYTDIGGKIPKGALLVGPPGTGKTLLARAVAGEAGVSFFRMSGADFVEMFVGVGAARVRDLFKQARDKAPCIVFIDEIDAIGKSRLNGAAGGNDEREQTLNQLLVEMDGFDATGGLIVLAATNRPDVLDPALLRPGRFDRQVLVDKPDLKGREAILLIHSRNVKFDPSVDLAAVARVTSGFAGADLANIVNEAALLAVRSGRTLVEQRDFSEAIEKTVAGLRKKTKVISPEERRIVAYHETGHAMIAAATPGSDPVQKISIVPRGLGALGYTLQMPVEDRHMMTEEELLGRIDVLMGGRAAEEVVFGKISTGAANDICRATDIARRMITDYGMSERFRNVALTQRGAAAMGVERGGRAHEPAFHREYSESTQQYIDEEIARVVEKRYAAAKAKLRDDRRRLEKIALALLERESLDEREFNALMADG